MEITESDYLMNLPTLFEVNAVGEHRMDRVGRTSCLVGYSVGPEALFVKIEHMPAFPVGSPSSRLPAFRKRSLPCTFPFTLFPSAFTFPAEGPQAPRHSHTHHSCEHRCSAAFCHAPPVPALLFII